MNHCLRIFAVVAFASSIFGCGGGGSTTGASNTSSNGSTSSSGDNLTNSTISVQPSITTASLAISTASLPSENLYAGKSQTLTASGGTGPYSWRPVGGALPTGLTLSTAGVISGVPTDTGPFTFTVMVEDSSNPVLTATQSFSIVTEPASLNNPVILSQQNMNFPTGGTNYLIQTTSLTNVDVGSGSNKIDFSANQVLGTVQFCGGSNTIIFRSGITIGILNIGSGANTIIIRPGVTINNLSIGGGLNTIYLPIGTSIFPPTNVTVLHYTP